jgi:hypothetical protein
MAGYCGSNRHAASAAAEMGDPLLQPTGGKFAADFAADAAKGNNPRNQ